MVSTDDVAPSTVLALWSTAESVSLLYPISQSHMCGWIGRGLWEAVGGCVLHPWERPQLPFRRATFARICPFYHLHLCSISYSLAVPHAKNAFSHSFTSLKKKNVVKCPCSIGSSEGKANCRVWARKTFYLEIIAKWQKVAKMKIVQKNTSILFSQIQLLLTFYPFLNHIWPLLYLFIFSPWTISEFYT